jgi:hypothetical protein
MLRRTITWLSIGLALGVIGTMWLGPSLIQWWWKVPGTPNGFSCDSQIAAATEWLVKLQLGFGAGAGVLFAIGANLFAAGRGAKKPASDPTASASPNQ